MTLGRPPVAAHIRFFAKVKKTETCWLWTGTKSKTYGKHSRRLPYGQFRENKHKMWSAHRWSYTYHIGPIPKGKFVCHSCDVPYCVNPSHLWLGEHYENMRDMQRKGRVNPCWGKNNFFYGKNPNHYRKAK